MPENKSENLISPAAADKLLAAHDGDLALLYLYIRRSGCLDMEKAAGKLCRTLHEMEAAEEKLRRMGLLSDGPGAPARTELQPPPEEMPQYRAEDLYRRSKEEYRQRRDLVVKMLRNIPGVMVEEPMGAFYVMVQLPVDDTDKFCQWCLTDFQYEGQTVMMAPGSGFYTNPEQGKKQVRMAYILNKEDLGKAMLVLKKALEAYNLEK